MVFSAFIKPVFYSLGYAGCYHNQLLSRIKYNNHLTILSLHRVSPQRNPFWSPLHPRIFDALLKYLTKHFTIITFHELNNVTTSKPKLILTFDDGYYDFIEYAMPILKKYKLKANQNVIPSQLLGKPPLWNIKLYDFLNTAPLSLIKDICFPGFDAKKIIKTALFNKIKFGLQLTSILKRLTYIERDEILHNLENTVFNKQSNDIQTRMIQLNEMPEVIKEHEVGVHSYAHNSMYNERMDYFIEDFKLCKNFFKQYAFPEMDIYAFPNGSYREEQVAYLKQNGIKFILLTQDKFATPISPYHRFNIGANSRYEAIFQALGIKSKQKGYA